MWGLAAGIPLGILQYFLSNMFIKIITLKEHENRKKACGQRLDYVHL